MAESMKEAALPGGERLVGICLVDRVPIVASAACTDVKSWWHE